MWSGPCCQMEETSYRSSMIYVLILPQDIHQSACGTPFDFNIARNNNNFLNNLIINEAHFHLNECMRQIKLQILGHWESQIITSIASLKMHYLVERTIYSYFFENEEEPTGSCKTMLKNLLRQLEMQLLHTLLRQLWI